MGSKQYRRRIYTAPRASSRLTIVVAAILLIGSFGFVGWKALGAKQQNQASQLPAAKQAVGRDTTEGLRQANANSQNNDLTIIKTKDILGDKKLPSTTKAGEAKLSIDITDSQGRSYGSASDFQIDTSGGKSYEAISLLIKTENITLSDCVVTQKYVPDNTYNALPKIDTLQAASKQTIDAFDGVHSLKVDCTKGTKTLSAGTFFRVADHLPQKCNQFSFSSSDITAASIDDLRTGMAGTWEGCVSTPWAPAYYVRLQLNADGTYSATSDEVLDGVQMNAFYYGTEQDDPGKTYSIDSFGENFTGQGTLSVVFAPGNTAQGTLSNVKLMGDHLSFSFLHQGQYGPISFQLYRK